MEDEIIEFMFLNQNLQVESIILSLITCPFGLLMWGNDLSTIVPKEEGSYLCCLTLGIVLIQMAWSDTLHHERGVIKL